MEKIHYEGKVENAYLDGDFYNMMKHLDAKVCLEAIDISRLNSMIRVKNKFLLDGVEINYVSEHNVLDVENFKPGNIDFQKMKLEDLYAKVTLEGKPEHISSVEDKIKEGIRKGYHVIPFREE